MRAQLPSQPEPPPAQTRWDTGSQPAYPPPAQGEWDTGTQPAYQPSAPWPGRPGEAEPAELWQTAQPAEVLPLSEAERSRLAPKRRRREGRTPPRSTQPAEPEIIDDEARSWLAVLTWTLCFFAVPMLLYLAWALTRDEVAEPGCVDASGAPCLAPRTEALVAFVDALPALGGALAVALLSSLLLRRLTEAWRPGMVGFAMAVIGTGLATLVTSILG